MADTERELEFGFVDKRNVQGAVASAGTTDSSANYNNVENLRARLTTINGSYFTAARLNNMTKNDMVYALRLADDAAGI